VKVIIAILLLVPFVALADVQFRADFESGRIQKKGSTRDGFWIHTLPIKQSGSTSFPSGSGGFGPDSPYDTRVATSRIPPQTALGTSSTVLPRAGKYFLETSLHYNKNYTELNAGLRKPRNKINPLPTERLDFDVEGYTGFSIYLPQNLETEAGAARRTLLYVQSTDASATLFTVQLGAPEVGKTKWAAIWHTDPTSIKDSSRAIQSRDLGLIAADRGKWTDFVVRYRWNPFSRRTNASSISGGKNQVYEGNKGILQVWKATGPVDSKGNRKMQLVVNLENEPVGLVPKANTKISQTFRLYKPAWQLQSTTIKHPIWIGFDEIKSGRVSVEGTTYADVLPGGKAPPRSPALVLN
jgi:hypothetical protein